MRTARRVGTGMEKYRAWDLETSINQDSSDLPSGSICCEENRKVPKYRNVDATFRMKFDEQIVKVWARTGFHRNALRQWLNTLQYLNFPKQLKQISSTTIPKVVNPTLLGQFRPVYSANISEDFFENYLRITLRLICLL